MVDPPDDSTLFGGGGSDGPSGDPPDEPPFGRLGPYRLIRRLGEGGMGAVYLAFDAADRRVAIKIPRDELVADPLWVARFRREAELASRVRHPSVVGVHEVGEDDGRLYLVMDHVEGTTLARWLSERRGGEALGADMVLAVVRMLAGVADGLDAVHRSGIIHRDVKPTNILVDVEGNALLTDFGVAWSADVSRLTVTDQNPGTLAYMSPEQLEGDGSLDGRSDVFSLGVTLHEAITGVRPFRGRTIATLSDAIRDHHPPRIEVPDLPGSRDLAVVLDRALEKDRRHRLASARLLGAELRRIGSGTRVETRPPSPIRRGARAADRHRRLIATIVIVVLLGIVLWLGVMTGSGVAPDLVRVRFEGDLDRVALVTIRELESDGNLGRPRSIPTDGVDLEPGFRRFAFIVDADEFVEIDAMVKGEELVLRPRFDAPPESMQRVGAGAYVVRAPGGGPDSMMTVTLPAFALDQTEVSNRAYLRFCAATGHPHPKSWPLRDGDEVWPPLDVPATDPTSLGGRAEGRLGSLPVVSVTLEDALAFAAWRGVRLPSELEWQAAMSDSMGPPDLEERLAWLAAAHDRPPGHPDSLMASYLACARPVDDDPLAAGRLLHADGNVRERTISFRGVNEVTVGPSWTDRVVPFDPGHTLVDPAGSASPTTGFRCARSLDVVLPDMAATR